MVMEPTIVCILRIGMNLIEVLQNEIIFTYTHVFLGGFKGDKLDEYTS